MSFRCCSQQGKLVYLKIEAFCVPTPGILEGHRKRLFQCVQHISGVQVYSRRPGQKGWQGPFGRRAEQSALLQGAKSTRRSAAQENL